MKVVQEGTQAYPSILNRAVAESNAEQYFSPHTRVLSDMVDYGTHTIPDCWRDSKKSLRDVVVLMVLVKQVLECLDASVELLKKNCVKPCMLTVRAAFEASIYTDIVLRGRDQRAARAYYVSYLRGRRRWANRAIRGTDERKAFLKDLRGMRFSDPFRSARGQRDAKAESARISAKLNGAQFYRWNERFDRREQGRPNPVSWYQPLFRRRVSLGSLSRILGRMHEYRSVYEIGSEETHGTRLGAHLEVPEDGKMVVMPLREPSEFPFIVKTLSTIVLGTYRRTLGYYRPSQLKDFANKYVQDWRPVLRQSIKVVPERQIVPIE